MLVWELDELGPGVAVVVHLRAVRHPSAASPPVSQHGLRHAPWSSCASLAAPPYRERQGHGSQCVRRRVSLGSRRLAHRRAQPTRTRMLKVDRNGKPKTGRLILEGMSQYVW
jgi:hypothetical protein